MAVRLTRFTVPNLKQLRPIAAQEPSVLQAGLWEDGDHREVRGLDQVFLTQGQLKAKGYAFAFEYGSEALQKSMAWLEFYHLREFRKKIDTGPLDLRDALDAAFAWVMDPSQTIAAEHIAVLKGHTRNWFGCASEVRRLLAAIKRLQ